MKIWFSQVGNSGHDILMGLCKGQKPGMMLDGEAVGNVLVPGLATVLTLLPTSYMLSLLACSAKFVSGRS